MSRFIDRTIPFYLDDGGVNSLGTVYFGEPGQDAKTNPAQIYFDRELTIPAPATQSLTAGGQLVNNLYAAGELSLIADDSMLVQVESYLFWYQDSSEVISEKIDIEDGVLVYTLTNTAIAASEARIEIAKDGSSIDGTLLIKDRDYTVSGPNQITLSQSYPGGALVFSSSSLSLGLPTFTITIDATTDLISSIAYSSAPTNLTLVTLGYSAEGDGGGAKWRKTGVTGLTPSQSPAQTGDGSLNDANGEQWKIAESFATAAMFGGVGGSSSQTVINSAMGSLSDTDTPAVKLFVSDQPYTTSARIEVPGGIEVDFGGGLATCSANDRVITVDDNSTVFNINADGSAQTGTPELSVVSLGSGVTAKNLSVFNGYSGLSLDTAIGTKVIGVETRGNQSRGVILDPFCEDCEITNIQAHDNGNAGILLGHGTNNCIIDKFWISGTNNASLWISQGSHHNKVLNGYIYDPVLSTSVGINITERAYNNIVENIDVKGYDRLIQFVGADTDGVYPSIIDGPTENNKAVNITGAGNNGIAGFAFHFQDDGREADQNIVESCEIESYYGGFLNTSDTGERTRIRDIKIENIGAGTVFGAMKTSTSKIVRLENIQGFETKEVYSSGFAIDSAGVVDVAIAHGLSYTPAASRVQNHVAIDTAVSDWAYDFIQVLSTDATNINVRIKIGSASATGSAVATLYTSVDTQADEGFDLQSIT